MRYGWWRGGGRRGGRRVAVGGGRRRRAPESAWKVIAAITTAIATTLGTSAALALHRYQFRGRKLLQALLFPPIAIPWLITGTAMLIFFFAIGIGRGLHAILLTGALHASPPLHHPPTD